MISKKAEKRQEFLIACGTLAVGILIIWVAFKYLLGWIMPFLIGYFIAAIVQPAVRKLHRKIGISKSIAGIITVLLFLCVTVLVLCLVITKIVNELSAVAGQIPLLLEQLAESVKQMSEQISSYIDHLPVEYSQALADALADLSQEMMQLSAVSSGTVSFALNLASKVPDLIFDLMITMISACFFSMDYDRINSFLLRQMPAKYREWVFELKEFIFNTMGKMLRAYLTLMLITFVELCIGLGLIHVSHFITVAAIIAILDFLPVLGTGAVMVPWIIIELLLGKVCFGVSLAILYGIMMIVRNILEPKIVGNRIGLYPPLTLLAMFVGLRAFGVSGLILLPILVLILKHMQETGRFKLWND